MIKTIWLDVETTGLNTETDTIIELAALYEDGIKKNRAVFHKFCKPGVKPESWDEPLKNRDNKTITDLTGITWDKLEKDGVSEATLYAEFSAFLAKRMDKFNKQDKAIFAAYNAKFDNNMVRALWDKNNDKYFGSWFLTVSLDIMSTVMLAVRHGILPIMPSYAQDKVAECLGIKFQAHSAIEDIKAARQIQLTLENKMGIKNGNV